MKNLLNDVLQQIVFWMAWVIIPLIMEILPAIGGFLILVKKRIFKRKEENPAILPEITLIIPVYNSSDTLEGCLQSVYDSSYPDEKITILLVDNKSRDNSFDIFCECQKKYPSLSMQWMKAEQGKSKALNMALFNSNGKYIIHIDSDGKLDRMALENMVVRFETSPDVHCLTGVILTDPQLIEKTRDGFLKLVRKCEFLEYCQAFLAGRNFESEFNSIYTLSGAFSAFRKSTILKTQLYNTDTVCEDTHVTFQVRKLMKKSVNLCEDALFFVDPIDDLEKLYTQRQRWQTGELEVSHMFLKKSFKSSHVFSDVMIKVLAFDHTFAFPRMIWYFALICLAFMNYPFKLIAGSIGILYALYVLSGFLFYINICSYLKSHEQLRKYYAKKLYLIIIMPLYNFVIFWVRFAGIINSITNRHGWKVRTFSEEVDSFKSVIKKDFHPVVVVYNKIKGLFNYK